jgi:hypothetical protein
MCAPQPSKARETDHQSESAAVAIECFPTSETEAAAHAENLDPPRDVSTKKNGA